MTSTFRRFFDTCPDESNFEEMFRALGDRDLQDRIREREPDKRHCDLLQIDARACPGCPKNPYRGETQLDLDEPDYELAARALDLGAFAEVGLLPQLADISPNALRAALIACEARRRARDRALAAIIARELAEILTVILLGGKKGA